MLIKDYHLDPNNVVVRQRISTFVNPTTGLTNAVLRLIKATDNAILVLAMRAYARLVTANISFSAAISGTDGLLIGTTLAQDATAAKFKTMTTTAVYLAAGVVKTKAPAAALVFSHADTINAGAAGGMFWGAWLVQVDAAGTVTTKSFAADQTFSSQAAAVASLPVADAGKPALGYIVLQSKAGVTWTANASGITADSNAVTFVSYVARTPVTAALVPLAGQTVDAAMYAGGDLTQLRAEVGEYIAILCTTDGTGAVTDAEVTIHHRAGRNYRGEG